MQRKYRLKSEHRREERDRKRASFIAYLIALVFFVMAIMQFAGSYNQYELGNALETQVHFVMGLVFLGIMLFIVWMVRLAARSASRYIVIDDDPYNE